MLLGRGAGAGYELGAGCVPGRGPAVLQHGQGTGWGHRGQWSYVLGYLIYVTAMLESGSAERAQAAEAPAWVLTWSDVGADVDADVGVVQMWGGRGCTERDGGPAEHRDSTGGVPTGAAGLPRSPA